MAHIWGRSISLYQIKHLYYHIPIIDARLPRVLILPYTPRILPRTYNTWEHWVPKRIPRLFNLYGRYTVYNSTRRTCELLRKHRDQRPFSTVYTLHTALFQSPQFKFPKIFGHISISQTCQYGVDNEQYGNEISSFCRFVLRGTERGASAPTA